jgi:hypothetical protein
MSTAFLVVVSAACAADANAVCKSRDIYSKLRFNLRDIIWPCSWTSTVICFVVCYVYSCWLCNWKFGWWSSNDNNRRTVLSILFDKHTCILWLVKYSKKAIPVTGHGGHRAMRCWGFHIVHTVGSQIAVRLSALRSGRALLPRKIPGTHFC